MRRLLILIGLMPCLAGSVLPAAGKAAKSDLEKLQGVWYLVSAKQNGTPLSPEKVKRTTIVFKDNTFTFPDQSEQATSQSGTVRINQTLSPRQMDAISTTGEVMLGIYQVAGKRYQVCFAPAGKPRPTGFISTPGSGYILQFWQRSKKKAEG